MFYFFFRHLQNQIQFIDLHSLTTKGGTGNSEKTPDKDNLNGLFLSKFLINSSRSNSAAACLPSFANSTLSNVLSSNSHCFLPYSTLKSVGWSILRFPGYPITLKINLSAKRGDL